MKISIFFVLCGLSFLGVRIGVATATECNGSEGLHKALLEHDKARIEFQYKPGTPAAQAELSAARPSTAPAADAALDPARARDALRSRDRPGETR